MFHSCTSLTQAPALPATTLADYCYAWMFDSCSSLSAIEVGFTSWTGFTQPTAGWLDNVAASGTFTCPAELPDTRGSGYIPTNWTLVKPTNAFRFTALAANSGVSLAHQGAGTPAPLSLEYSTDGQTWSAYTLGESVSMPAEGDSAYFRAAASNVFSTHGDNDYYQFSLSGQVRASGDATTLLEPAGNVLSAHDNVFIKLFKSASALKDAADQKLPSLSVGSGAYNRMFDGSGISAAPELPATALGANCYGNMFQGCRSLV